jgi:hypothetical protein
MLLNKGVNKWQAPVAPRPPIDTDTESIKRHSLMCDKWRCHYCAEEGIEYRVCDKAARLLRSGMVTSELSMDISLLSNLSLLEQLPDEKSAVGNPERSKEG